MVRTGCADLEGNFRIANASADITACFVQVNFAGDHMRWLGYRRHLIRAEAANICNASGLSQFDKQINMRVVCGDDNCATLNHIIGHIVENLALGARDIGFGVKMLNMRRSDMCDDGAMRPHHAHQRINLTGMVHADLENAIGAILRHAREAQRHTYVIIEGFFRSKSFARL